MQSDISGQVLSVTGSPTRNGGTKFDVAFSDGNSYSTFDGAMAQKANSLAGQSVSARVEAKPSRDGQRTFFNLVDIAPQGQLVPLAGTPIGAGTFAQPIQGAAAPLPAGIPMQQGRGGMSPEREAKIVKQSSFSTALAFVGSLFQGAGPEALDEAKGLALSLAEELYTHVMGGTTPLGGAESASAALAGATPTPTTPEGVADAVNGAAGTPVVGVGAAVPWQ